MKMQKLPHTIVMQVTESDSVTQLAVIGQLRNIKTNLPDATIEVVCHANALGLLLKTDSNVSKRIKDLGPRDVHFIACENTMVRRKVIREDLLPEAETVSSGLVEIILKQEEGWLYIKGGY
jgi:uncharacterized protein